jgi:MinD superfamily P-loop ATPase
MDNLKIFSTGIRVDHIITYATQIKTDLYMIAGARLDKGITGGNKEFDRHFIDSCLEGFDIVIVDVGKGTGVENKLYLDSADSIISVITPNEIAVDQLFNDSTMKTALAYYTNKKTVNVINKLYSGWETGSVVSRYKKRYSLCKPLGLNYDGDLLNACCADRNFYSFIMRKLKGIKNDYMQQLNDICSFIISELSIEEKSNESIRQGSLTKRFHKISIY